MAYILCFCLLLWSIFLKGALAGERCFIWKELKSEYCELGCCGEGFDRECCSMVWIIIGSCIGGILLVACIIAVVCCCVKHKGKSGRVMGTNTTSVAYIGQQNYPGQQMQPMVYGNAPYAQPYPGIVPPPYQAQAQYPTAHYPTAPSEPNFSSDPAYPPSAPPAYK